MWLCSKLCVMVNSALAPHVPQVTKIVLDGPGSWGPVPGVSSSDEPKELAAKIRGSAATSKEVRALCEDLQVGQGRGGARRADQLADLGRKVWSPRAAVLRTVRSNKGLSDPHDSTGVATRQPA
jgi:hypothetical protein